MPSGKTKFNPSWMEKLDNNGKPLGSWCKRDTSTEFAGYCTVCMKSISCSNSGANQLISHADGQKHKENMKCVTSYSQKRLFGCAPKPSSSQGGGDRPICMQVQPSHKEQVQKAEILWALKVASSGYPYRSCDGIPALFQAMFPGPVSRDFTMSRSKISYMMSDGLKSHFRKEISLLLKLTCSMYSLQYDETGNAQGKKQCDVLIRFWNEKTGEVCTMFLKSIMFGHAKGKDVGQALIDTLLEEPGIPVQNLISLGSDGPNVNKTVWNYINDYKKSEGLSELVDFMPCSVHVVHNAFRKGLHAFGENAEELACDLFQWFKSHTCQREDYSLTLEALGMDDDLFIRHVQCRWLTLLQALKKVENQWEAIKQFFLKDLPRLSKDSKTDKMLHKNARYQRICQKMKSKATLFEVQFLISVGPVFERFLTMFQKQEPLIHFLYLESRDILKTVLNRFIKLDLVANANGSKICFIDVRDVKNCVELNEVEIGAECPNILKKLDSGRQKELLMDVRSFYQEVSAYLAQKLPIKVPVVKYAQCLHPEVREQELAFNYLKKLSALLPCLSDDERPLIHDEWKILKSESIPEEKLYNEEGDLRRIDHYWSYIFNLKNINGKLRYPNLKKLVASCLCLCHGNADVERSLSINKKLLTEERTKLSAESLNGLRLTRDAVAMYGGMELDVPITKDMHTYVKQAYSKYSARMEEERKEAELTLKRKKDQMEQREREEKMLKENEERKRKINEKEKEVKEDEAQLNDRLSKANNVFEEANKRLATAIKNKNFAEMNVAQGLLEVAKADLDKVRVSMEKCREQRSDIDRKRRKLIDSYQSKQKSLVSKSDQYE